MKHVDPKKDITGFARTGFGAVKEAKTPSATGELVAAPQIKNVPAGFNVFSNAARMAYDGATPKNVADHMVLLLQSTRLDPAVVTKGPRVNHAPFAMDMKLDM